MDAVAVIVLLAIAGVLAGLARWLRSTGLGLVAITYTVLAIVVPNVR